VDGPGGRPEVGHSVAMSASDTQRAIGRSLADRVAQRIVRAKHTLTEARVPFDVPSGPELASRLPSVLEVIYLIFNEGYSATAGDNWVRPALCEDALRLGRVLAELVSREPEVHGLVALMEFQASRLRARVGPLGEPILLLDQDRARWDYLLIRRGLAALERAQGLGGTLGPYVLQAAIAACHARAHTPEETSWERIVALYNALAALAPSPIGELNRAVALALGPAEGLEIVDTLTLESSLKDYHLLPSVPGGLLAKLGRFDEALGSSSERHPSREIAASASCPSIAPPRAEMQPQSRRTLPTQPPWRGWCRPHWTSMAGLILQSITLASPVNRARSATCQTTSGAACWASTSMARCSPYAAQSHEWSSRASGRLSILPRRRYCAVKVGLWENSRLDVRRFQLQASSTPKGRGFSLHRAEAAANWQCGLLGRCFGKPCNE
jgi:hypothetical protein